MNNKNAAPINPCTRSVSARRRSGMAEDSSAMSAPHSDSTSTHSSIEPSWLPHTPEIL